jgi:hypothetical protein
MYKGYSDKFFFWELVVMARKVLLVFISVYFSYDTQTQSIMAVFLVVAGTSRAVTVCAIAERARCTTALASHVWALPFETATLNAAEFFSLIASFFTFWMGTERLGAHHWSLLLRTSR